MADPNPIPFDEWKPDLSDRTNPASEAKGVISVANQYGPFPDIQTYGPVSTVDSYTKVLLHFDGADASTNIEDDAPNGDAHIWTAAGNAQLDTVDKQFGPSSLLCDGTGDWVSTPDHSDFALGSGDFTIDLWFKCNVAGGTYRRIAGQCDNAGTIASLSFVIERQDTNNIRCYVGQGAGAFGIAGVKQYTNAVNIGWHHLAFVRTGNVLKLFIDGVQEGTNVTFTGAVNDSSNALAVGASGEVTTATWQGWLDEFRISVGIARWTAGYATGNDANTKLLLHFDGPDAATYVADSALGTQTVAISRIFTAAGNAQLDTAQSKFGGVSLLCDGTGDWITTPDSADLEPGSGDWTLECWFRAHGGGGILYGIIGKADAGLSIGGTSYGMMLNAANHVEITFSNGSTRYTLGGTSVFTGALNLAWHHAAAVRSGNTLLLYVDGLLENQLAVTGSVNNIADVFFVGALATTGFAPWDGWIDELRLSLAVNRYTGVDVPDSFTKILLHMNGIDAATLFPDHYGSAAHTWTAAGNAQVDTADSKFGGASLLCDGVGDWITAPDSADFTLGSGAWTCDFWFKCSAAGGALLWLCGQQDGAGTAASMSFQIFRTAGNVISAFVCVGGVTFSVVGTTQYTNALNTGWHHCALIRTGNTGRLFLDGVQEGGDFTITGTVNDSANVFGVGVTGAAVANGWNGWIDEFRLSVGVARWTANFTPPTAAYNPGFSVSLATATAFGADASTFTAPTEAYGFGGGAEDVVLGADTFYDSSTDPHIFFGDATRLYRMVSRTEEDVSIAGGYQVGDDETWQFAQFGDNVVAVSANVVTPQKYVMGTSTDFGNLPGTPPSRATSVARVNDFLMMGKDFTVYWCAFNDIDDWVPDIITQAGSQQLDQERGEIISIVGLDYAAIFQERGVRRAIYVGAPVIWDFGQDYVEKARGCIARNAAVPWGRIIFYAADDGFYAFDGQSSTPIGYGKIDSYFTRNLNYTWRHKISCGIDYSRKLVVWAFPAGSAQLPTDLLMFSLQDGRWTHDTIPLEFMFDSPAEPLTVENFDSLFPADDLDGVITPDDIDSAAFDDRRVRLAAFQQSPAHLLGLFTGPPRAATIDTKEFEPAPGQRGLLTEVWPLGDYEQASISSSVGYRRALPGATVAFTNPTNMNRVGYCPQRIDGRFLRVRQQITAGSDWRRAEGVHTTAIPTGKR